VDGLAIERKEVMREFALYVFEVKKTLAIEYLVHHASRDRRLRFALRLTTRKWLGAQRRLERLLQR
jgi:hypothetical protein